MKNSSDANPRMVLGRMRCQNDVSWSAPSVIDRTLAQGSPGSRFTAASVALPGVLGLLLLAFLLVPILELYLFVEVSASIGFAAAFFWIVAVSVIGAWLVRREGMGALARANRKVAAGELPTDELINGILIVVAGALMLTPGFLTDATGLLLLFPPSRAVLRRSLRKRFRAGPIVIGARFPGAGSWSPGAASTRSEVWDAESWEEPPDRRELG